MSARISLRGVSKNYRLYDSAAGRIKQLLWCGLRKYYVEFPALKNIDLEIEPGTTVGVIGHNGAGKSTLLELISNISAPTTGTVEVRGKIVSLLDLGSGLNPEFTGRENIFLYGCVLGMSRDEIRRKFDAIAAFADIGDFIEQPLRAYSNGMLMRLAFAIVSQVDADVLIFDEILGVGDSNFQFKCFQHIQKLQEKGATILLVSHNLQMITSVCSRVVILDHGQKYFDGGPRDAYWAYCRLVSLPDDAAAAAPAADGRWATPMGTGEARILKTDILDAEDRPRRSFRAGDICDIKLSFVCDHEIPKGSIGIAVQNNHGLTVYGFNTASDPLTEFSWKAGVPCQLVVRLRLNLAPGVYFPSITLNRLEGTRVVSLHTLEAFAEISIQEKQGVFGTSNLFAVFK
jgi:lipopolysaccharide transport system ATP-binding protein